MITQDELIERLLENYQDYVSKCSQEELVEEYNRQFPVADLTVDDVLWEREDMYGM